MQEEIGAPISLDRLAHLIGTVGGTWPPEGPINDAGHYRVQAVPLGAISREEIVYIFQTSADLVNWVQDRTRLLHRAKPRAKAVTRG